MLKAEENKESKLGGKCFITHIQYTMNLVYGQNLKKQNNKVEFQNNQIEGIWEDLSKMV
jgi:hypothetical protein